MYYSIDRTDLTPIDKKLNEYLKVLNRKQTPRNREIIKCFIREYNMDKDYIPYNYNMLEKYFEDRDVKKVLD